MALPTEDNLQTVASNAATALLTFIFVYRALAPPLFKLLGSKTDTGQHRKVLFDVVKEYQSRIDDLEERLAAEKALTADLLRQLDRYTQD